jgi:hypothetical protein
MLCKSRNSAGVLLLGLNDGHASVQLKFSSGTGIHRSEDDVHAL